MISKSIQLESEKSFLLRRVISVCEVRDIEVWKIASREILRRIIAAEYVLICPQNQIADFNAASAAGWRIVGEDQFALEFGLFEIRRRVIGENVNRVNWLFQQFLKINAIARSDLLDEEIVLIWDADTVPLRDLYFIDRDSRNLLYYHGKEHHLPYFQTIKSLFGFGKLAERSFIAQCLPIRVGWVREMVNMIEARFGMPYVEAVLKLLPGKSGSEFSEYETIGSWILENHQDEIVFRRDNRWIRSGANIFGVNLHGVRARILLIVLGRYYDFVAVEKWKRPITLRRFTKFLRRLVGAQGRP